VDHLMLSLVENIQTFTLMSNMSVYMKHWIGNLQMNVICQKLNKNN